MARGADAGIIGIAEKPTTGRIWENLNFFKIFFDPL